MARFLKVTPEMKEKATLLFSEALEKAVIPDGSFSYSIKFGDASRKAILYVSDIAYVKQQMLIHTTDKEIAWHGTARRGGGENEDVYFIDDIYVYPQEAAGATVETDQQKYQDWLYDLPDDVFKSVRMQGHSHVNMGVSPSTTDEKLYHGMLEQVGANDFYIFLIMNKRGDTFVRIYDMAKNVVFEKEDVEIIVEGEFKKFFEDAKSKVTTAVPAAYTTNYGGYRQNGTYYPAYGASGGTNWPAYGTKRGGTKESKKSKKTEKITPLASLVDDDDDYSDYYNGQFH